MLSYLVREVEKVTNELGDNGAPPRRLLFLRKRTAIISAAKAYAIANVRIALMPCSFAARMAANSHVWHLHVLPQ